MSRRVRKGCNSRVRARDISETFDIKHKDVLLQLARDISLIIFLQFRKMGMLVITVEILSEIFIKMLIALIVIIGFCVLAKFVEFLYDWFHK